MIIISRTLTLTRTRTFGDGRHALGKADGGWYATSDGGKTWGKATLTDGGRHLEGDLEAAGL